MSRKIKKRAREIKRGKIKNLQIPDVKISIRFIIIAIAVILAVLFLLSFFVDNTDEGYPLNYGKMPSSVSDRVIMSLPAVDAQGKGVNTILIVEVIPGNGRTLTDIDNLLFWADTQHSIRVAKKVAENITKKKFQNYDIVYTIEANASLIGGPSAGAALTLATIAALENKELRKDVMITGSINHDGSIGPVSSILEKARTSKEQGARLFLVPLLQSGDTIYEQAEYCETFGQTTICTTETRPKKIDVEGESGIEIIEVASIQEAMKYFF